MKKIICCLSVLNIFFCMFSFKIVAFDEKSIIPLSTEHPFSTNSIIVCMKSDLRDEFVEYSIDDFKEVYPNEVINNDIYSDDLFSTKANREESDLSKTNLKKGGNSLTLKWDKNFTKKEIIEMINKLKSRDDVYYVQPNYVYELQSTMPVDAVTDYRQYYNICNVMKAWDYTTGSHAIKVGIIDSGIDGTHPDLIPNLNNNLHKDFTSNIEQPLVDNYGHGTCVAGIIGARGNNNIGISGVCWDVSLVSLKIFDSLSSSTNGIIDSNKLKMAIDYANLNNIQILNFSGFLKNTSGEALNDLAVYNALAEYDGLFVCSAGNCSADFGNKLYNDLENNNDLHSFYPANYSSTLYNVISVGGLDINGKRNLKSHYGENTVSLFANYETYTTSSSDSYGYQYFSGTSCSAPMVAGSLALIYSMDIDYTPYEVKTLLLNGCNEFDVQYLNGSSTVCSYVGKKLNLENSIRSSIYLSQNINSYIIQNTSYNDFCENVYLSNNNINYNNKKFYKLNVIDDATYLFRVDTMLNSNIILYDENLNQIDIYNCNNIGHITVFEPLTVGTYYVKVETTNNNIENITFSIFREQDYYLSYNIVNHIMYESINILNIRYVHTQESGLYSINLILYDFYNNLLMEFPDNMLEIYSNDERNEILDFTTYNDLTVDLYLENGCTYYFDIESNISDLMSIEIVIVENS